MPLLLVLVCLVVALAPAPAAAAAVAARWVPPVEGPVVVRRAFDPPAVRWGAGHRGVDLASYAGVAVRAAGAGRVSFAGVLAGRGVVVVTHGALRTTYEPVRALLPAGAAVAAGAVVGVLRPGHAGPARAGESLLHWGLLRGDTYLDPLSLLPRGPSRLVPVEPAEPGPAPGRPAAALPAAGATAPAPPRTAPIAARAGTGSVAGLAVFAALGALVVRRPGRVSPSGRRACPAAAGPPSCASGRSGSRSRRAPGRSPPA